MSQHSASKAPRIDLNDKVNKEDLLGTLIVVLLKARNLLDKHSFRKSDVFAQAILNGAEKRTHVDIKGGQHPEWDGEVRFPILKNSAAKYRKMEISCFSVEPRSEDLMGKATVDISETLRTGEFDDWVQLEIDGVARGELYLEMTYYTNSPAPTPAAPNKILSAVVNQNNGLNRRPSKLSPSERLSRPQTKQPPAHINPQAQRYPNTQEYPPTQPHVNGPSHLSSMSNLTFTRPNEQPTHIRNNSVPTMPGAYPDNSNVSSKPPQTQPAQQSTPLPTILRPGPAGAASPPAPIQHPQNGLGHGRYPSEPSGLTSGRPPQGSPPNSNPYMGAGGSGSQPSSPPRNPYVTGSITPPNPYIDGPGAPLSGRPPPGIYAPAVASQAAVPATSAAMQSQSIYTGYRLNAGQVPAGAPLLWQGNNIISAPSSNTPFYFPQPTVTPGRGPAVYGYVDNEHPAHHRTTSGGLALPKFYGQPPRNDTDPYLQTRYQTPLPLPPDASSSMKASTPSQSQYVHASRPEPLKASSPPSPPPKTPTPIVDKARLEALRLVEQEAARRREQELKDLELAMQLDREFNLQ
ncbi:hypothetical protein BDN70DRAFT_928442 [Pholiota conissans]|uniref:C2 domain-containing protein n=1 Tax=Pholiota conissans TaxID=109636 RepID=A0A9P5ZA28_9AGAR|nr:hypothetical protein BDN70DRAFT_928442 [Pholiota conissans]